MRHSDCWFLKLRPCATAKNIHEADARRKGIFIAQLNPRGAFQLEALLIGDSTEGSSVTRASKRVATELGFDPDDRIKGGSRS